jgi:hypothetical protein
MKRLIICTGLVATLLFACKKDNKPDLVNTPDRTATQSSVLLGLDASNYDELGELHNAGLDYTVHYPGFSEMNPDQVVEVARSYQWKHAMPVNENYMLSAADMQSLVARVAASDPSELKEYINSTYFPNNVNAQNIMGGLIDNLAGLTETNMGSVIEHFSQTEAAIKAAGATSNDDLALLAYCTVARHSITFWYNFQLNREELGKASPCWECIKAKWGWFAASDGLGALAGFLLGIKFGPQWGVAAAIGAAIGNSALAVYQLCGVPCGIAPPPPKPPCNCPPGSQFDGANCWFKTVPGRSPFIWAGNFYYAPVQPGNQCPYGTWFDGANCFYKPVPAGWTPFIYKDGFYVKCP